jgi:hypothetical protein
MDAFDRQLKSRLPLACATLELFDFAFDDALLAAVYEQHRGRCYTDTLTFPDLLRLVRDCLLQHAGSAHKLFVELERDGREPVDESNFYRKLARTPVAVSRALLRQCTARLTELMPVPAVLLPGCFEDLEVVVVDGKKVKRAAKRLKPTRGYSGKLIGAKALVAMHARSGLAIAMSDALDGEANDVPLVGELMPQVRDVVPRPVLWLADRQFCDAATFAKLAGRPGDRFVVRVRKGLGFQAEPPSSSPSSSSSSSSPRTLLDDRGRVVTDEVGTFGTGKHAMRLRRVTLRRPGEAADDDDVVLLTDLLDHKQFDASDLLKLYRKRWGVEQMFQQVTETFALEHLIGCRPRAILLQLALCLLMYNLIQVVKSYVAEDGRVEVSIVSTYGLFYDLKRELHAWAYLGGGGGADAWRTRVGRDASQMTARLRGLLCGSWDPVAYTKAIDKKPRKKKPPPKQLPGGHTSVQRLLDGRVQVK